LLTSSEITKFKRFQQLYHFYHPPFDPTLQLLRHRCDK
jgi:hypothetical protein